MIVAPLYNFAQTFYVDKSLTDQHNTLTVCSIDLYFKHKPLATNNQSGVNNPGITLYLCETAFNVPKITQASYQNFARCEYNAISTSSDASVATKFIFNSPVRINSGKLYAFVVSYDGNEAFFPWVAKKGSWIWGTRTIYQGPPTNFVGNYFEFVSVDNTNAPGLNNTQGDYSPNWRSLFDTNLKFSVNCSRYFLNGTPVSQSGAIPGTTQIHRGTVLQEWDSANGHLTFDFPSYHAEGIAFDINQSTIQAFVGAQRVFQNTVFYPGGSANVTVTCNNSTVVTANAQFSNGATFNWNTVFASYTGPKFLTLFSTSVRNVRKVVSVISNTVIQLDEPVTFSNTTTKFMLAPVATVDSIFPSSPLGKRDNFLWLIGSNANSSVRFVNNSIDHAATANAISAGGTGYNNNDVLYVKGFENVANKVVGGYVAIANLTTNSTGGITSILWSNVGCGFVNTAAMVTIVANSTSIGNTTSNTSAGSGATFAYTIGTTLQTEMTNNTFKNCIVQNLGINDVIPFFSISVPVGCSYDLNFRSQYYVQDDPATLSGQAYFVNATPDSLKVQINQINRFVSNNVPCFVSFSNEFVTRYSNGSVNDKVSALTAISNTFVLQVNTTSNNDFICVSVDTPPTIEMSRYIINNDYTNEHKNQGNAWAKHLTSHIIFTRLAEDLRVFLTAYKPPNTDIQVYARIQNSGDTEAFDDEDYTRLQLIDGTNIISSINQANDYIELTYGFQPYPNVQFTIAGSITTANASAAIVGSNTTFQSNLAAGDLIRIYDPLFPNNNFLVATVNAITDNTNLTIDQIVLSSINPALINSGLKLDKLQFKNQGFNNVQRDNVVRYYNASIVKFDGYDNMQIKVVLLSSRQQNIPRIHNVRATGVSA